MSSRTYCGSGRKVYTFLGTADTQNHSILDSRTNRFPPDVCPASGLHLCKVEGGYLHVGTGDRLPPFRSCTRFASSTPIIAAIVSSRASRRYCVAFRDSFVRAHTASSWGGSGGDGVRNASASAVVASSLLVVMVGLLRRCVNFMEGEWLG